jgi:NHL repeat
LKLGENRTKFQSKPIKKMDTRIKLSSPAPVNSEVKKQPQPLPLSSQGAELILGKSPAQGELAIPVEPTATTLFGPRGACLVSETGALWVSDTGHHRLLGWRNRPQQDGQPADWVIGQPNFNSEGQNAKKTPGSATLSVPTGVCVCGEGLAVADAWNHRVLIWKSLPEDSNVPADLVLGQADFTHNESNRGSLDADAHTLHWPYGVLYHQGRLFVADTGNRRVLIWHELPPENGQPADVVLGQPDLVSRNENGGDSPTASSMRWPHSITFWEDNLVLIDAGNNRAMIWDGIPTENNTPCAVVLGQKNFESVEMNQGVYCPTPSSLSLPYGLSTWGDWLFVADTANSRLLGWKKPLSILSLQGADADGITGQRDFQSKGENRDFGLAMRDSFCWPYGIQICGNTAVIADSGNNRVLLWNLTPDA